MFTNGRQMEESTATRRYGHFITVMNVAAPNGTSRLDKFSKKKIVLNIFYSIVLFISRSQYLMSSTVIKYICRMNAVKHLQIDIFIFSIIVFI